MCHHRDRKPGILPAALVILVFASHCSGRAQSLAEALDATNLFWITGGNSVWFAQTTNTYDGIDAVRSGSVCSNQTSWIETTVLGPATISFRELAQGNPSVTRSFNWKFSVNGLSPDAGVRPFGPSWTQWIYDLGKGTNLLRWTAFDLSSPTNSGFVCLDEFLVSPPRPLGFEYQPADLTVYSGEWVRLWAQVVGTPPIRYQWRKEGTNVFDATNDWIVLEHCTTNDSGVYDLVVSNSQDEITSSNAVLTVLPPSAPFFTCEPEGATAYSGQTVSLSAVVSGSPPFTYQWRKEGTNVPGASETLLTLTNLSAADAGKYTLFVTNNYGRIESSNAVLSVIPSVAPVISRQPRSLEVAEGVNTWMTFEAAGVPDPCYLWSKEGDPSPDPTFPPVPVLCQSSHRSFNDVTTNDAGVYFATAGNYGGETDSWGALLTVLPPISSVGSWDQGAMDIAVAKGFAFLASGTNGLVVLSVTNPAAPERLGNFATAGPVGRLSVAKGLAFLAEGSAGVQIVSVTNPANPVLVGDYDTPGSAGDIAVQGNLACVADGKAGLLILDIGNPARPYVVGSYQTNFTADHVCLAGNNAVVSSPYREILPGTNVAGLFVIDISDPAHPSEVGRLPLGIGNLDVRDQLIFGIAMNSLRVITITNPAQPLVIGTFDHYGSNSVSPRLGISAADVRVVNDLAYVAGSADGQSSLYVLDVRDPTEPIPVGYYTNSGQATALWVQGNWVYLTGGETPVQIIETPFTNTPVAAPIIWLSSQTGLQLHLQGRRGFHYEVEYTDALTGPPWLSLQTLLLTNDSAVVEVPADAATRFFRLRQLE